MLTYKYTLCFVALFILNCLPTPVTEKSADQRWLLNEFVYYEGNDTILYKTFNYDYTFDKDGKLLEKVEKDTNNSQTKKYSYFYNDGSILTRATIYYNSTELTYNYVFTYKNDLLVTTEVKRPQLNKYYKYVNQYTGNNLTNTTLYKITFDSLMHEISSVQDSTDYYYKSNVKILENINPKRNCTYSYGSNNKLTKLTQFSTDTSSNVAFTIEYSYDNEGNKFEERYYSSGTSIQWMARYYYKTFDNVSIVPEFHTITF